MFKKSLSLALIVLLALSAESAVAFGKSKSEKAAEFTGKVKAHILKLGTGETARVKLKLRDKTKLEGYVTEAGADSFTVIDTKTGAAATVAYPQVAQAKGNNLSTGAKIAIGVGIGVALLIIYAVVKSKCDGFC